MTLNQILHTLYSASNDLENVECEHSEIVNPDKFNPVFTQLNVLIDYFEKQLPAQDSAGDLNPEHDKVLEFKPQNGG